VQRGTPGVAFGHTQRRHSRMGFEPSPVRDTVIDQRDEKRMSQCCQLIAEPGRRLCRAAITRCFHKKTHPLACCEIDGVVAIHEKAIGEHLHGSQKSLQNDRRDPIRANTRRQARPVQRARRNFVYNSRQMLRFLTAGESHGRALVVILEGLPAGLAIDPDAITRDLRRRQGGYGRGRRMAIESDRAEILSGVRAGETLGGPVAMLIENRDWPNWQHTMHPAAIAPAEAGGARRAPVTRPRPGHADLAGGVKYGRSDLRDILERASARETAARVAAGALARQLLSRAGVKVTSHVFRIGSIALPDHLSVTFDRAAALDDEAPLRCVDVGIEQQMIAEIDQAREAGDTLGGAFEVIATNVPIGLGSYVQWDRKLDGRLAQALMSIPAIKAVGLGIGPEASTRPGSRVHDEIVLDEHAGTLTGLARPSNNAGGLEGGVTNGQDVRASAYMKPISTLMKPLRSVDLATMSPSPAAIERSDVCAVPAAAVVGEAMVAFVLADALLERFGGDSIPALERAMAAADADLRTRFSAKR
jgi:chorismate synthase